MTAYAPLKNDGVVSIHMPRGLSVTVESARIAAKEMLTDYAVIDSQFISTMRSFADTMITPPAADMSMSR